MWCVHLNQLLPLTLFKRLGKKCEVRILRSHLVLSSTWTASLSAIMTFLIKCWWKRKRSDAWEIKRRHGFYRGCTWKQLAAGQIVWMYRIVNWKILTRFSSKNYLSTLISETEMSSIRLKNTADGRWKELRLTSPMCFIRQ